MVDDIAGHVVAHVLVQRPPPGSVPSWATSFIIFRTRHDAIDMGLQHMTGTKDENAAGQDRNLFSGFRVAPDTPPLLSYGKGPEPADFNRFTMLQVSRDPIQDVFKQVRRLVPGEANLRVDHFGDMSARNRQHGRTLCRSNRHVKVLTKKMLPDQGFAADHVARVTGGSSLEVIIGRGPIPR